jgi:gas vesicle protein
VPNKNEPDVDVVIIKQDTGSGAIPGFLLGLLAGAAVGLVRAPRSGLQTRRQLTQRVTALRSRAQSKLPGQG